MNVKSVTTRSAAAVAFALVASVPAPAQTATPIVAPTLSFSSSMQRDTWHTVLLVSAVVAIVGVATNDGTLTVLGGAGILLSLFESNQSGFRFRRDVDLLSIGPLSFGVNPFGQMGMSPAFTSRKPSPYVQLTFKF